MADVMSAKAVLAEQRRGLWVTRRGEGPEALWSISGEMVGLRGEHVAGMIAGWSRPLDGGDARLPEQRRMDALYALCDAASGARGGSVRARPDTRLVVIAPLSAVRGEPGAPAAVTADGHVVDPGALAALRCTADIEVLVVADPSTAHPTVGAVAPDGARGAEADAELLRRALMGLVPEPLSYRIEPLVHARGRRLATGAQRAALVARDHGCVLCGRSATWCVAHHLREYEADDGRTDLVNVALICSSCHTDLHRRGKHLHPPWFACEACSGAPHGWVRLVGPPVVAEVGPDQVRGLRELLRDSSPSVAQGSVSTNQRQARRRRERVSAGGGRHVLTQPAASGQRAVKPAR